MREEERQAWQRIVRVLSHEINNSLTPIRSIARSVKRMLERELGQNGRAGEMREGLDVIAGRADYEWAREIVRTRLVPMKEAGKLREILFSPVWDAVDFKEMAEWILEDHLPVRYQIQLHKIIWGANVPGV